MRKESVHPTGALTCVQREKIQGYERARTFKNNNQRNEKYSFLPPRRQFLDYIMKDIYVTDRDEMSVVVRLDICMGYFFFLLAQLLREDTILARVDPSRGNHSSRRTSRAASIHTRRSAPVRTHMMVRALSRALLSMHTAQHCSTARKKVKCRNNTSLPELDDAMSVCAYSMMWQPPRRG